MPMLSKPDAEKKLFLLDAFALIYRAYFAFINNPRVNSQGMNTSATFGFITLVWDIIRTERPTHLGVVFDPAEEKSERGEIFEFYKANRQEMPEDIRISIPYIIKILEGMRIPVLVVEGYEADDVVGTLALQAEQKGFYTYMITSDKDYGQLVTDKVLWYRPGRFSTPNEILGPAEVCKKFGIERTSQVIDLLALMGDSADNIPGIPGVGEKTALKLIEQFGDVENLINNTDQLTGKMREKVEQNIEMALMSKRLATIILDVPITLNEEELALKSPDKDSLRSLFAELEFRTLSERILGESVASGASPAKKSVQASLFAEESSDEPENTELKAFRKITDTPHQYFTVDDPNWRKDLAALLIQQKEVCVDTETTSLDPLTAELVGISFCFRVNQAFYIPLPADRNACISILEDFRAVFESPDIVKIAQNLKYDYSVLIQYGFQLRGPMFDTMLAHYVVQPEMRHGMDFLSETYLHYTPIATEELLGPRGKKQKTMREVDVAAVSEYCNEDTDVTFQLSQILGPMIPETKTERVFQEIELPLIPILSEMESTGIRIDESFLKEYSDLLQKEATDYEEQVYEMAGEKFNLGSPKQLGDILFEKLKLDPKAKKTKTGQYATGEDVLMKLSHAHPIIAHILDYREVTKLKSTYVDALPLLIHPNTGRVHTSFMQAVAVTGRLSSQNPNLQNIPVRTERGRKIRRAFIPRNDDHILLSADYSQIELRIVAAISGDPNMMEAFNSGKDIHTATAARVYGIPEEEVTKEMRYKAKSVNFGIIYGQGAFGLAENLGISRTEAKQLIENYFAQYGSIRKYMDDTIASARQNGYVETLYGRKRWLKDINSANFTVKGIAERNAINTPIQGSAADMIKLAMIEVDKAFKQHGFKSQMVLQVHDELVFDALRSEVEIIKPVIIDCMQKAMPLTGVPVVAEVGMGENWLEAH